ncbi:unnamed protein product, partial [Mesorhabditis spiculigera]
MGPGPLRLPKTPLAIQRPYLRTMRPQLAFCLLFYCLLLWSCQARPRLPDLIQGFSSKYNRHCFFTALNCLYPRMVDSKRSWLT